MENISEYQKLVSGGKSYLRPYAIKFLVWQYRKQVGDYGTALTMRKFADALTQVLAIREPRDFSPASVSYGAVQNWESGRNLPNDDLLLKLTRSKILWIADFAKDCQACISPDDFQVATKLGRDAQASAVKEFQNA